MSEQTASSPAPSPTQRLPLRAFALAIGVGLIAAAGGSLLLEVIHLGERLFYDTIPAAFGWETTPIWWVAVMLLTGALVILIAQHLPGNSGEGPLTGFHFNTPPINAISILVAAAGTLMFGFVLGPEAPLIILGTTIGALIARRADSQTTQAAMLLGGVASIGAVFGNPFVTAFMILEFIALGAMPRILMLPMFVALGAGYLTQVGIGSWGGFGASPLSVPDLPSYDAISFLDIAVSILASLVAAIVAIAARELAVKIDLVNTRHRRLMPFVAAIAITGLVAIVVYGFDLTPDMVLFSGQGQAMSTLIDQTAIGVVVAIVLIKAIGYAISLGSGMRGGPIFPATFLGVGVGVLFALLFSGTAVSPMAAAGIAATATAMIRLPFTSAMLALLLIGGAGMEVAPFAIIGAVVGFIVRQWLDARSAGGKAAAATSAEPEHH